MTNSNNYQSWSCKRTILLALFAVVIVLTVSLLRARVVNSPVSFSPVDVRHSGETSHVLNPIQNFLNISGQRHHNESKNLSLENLVPQLSKRPKKYFLDCGANTGSTYKIFHEIWPNPEDYYMISFEIDPNLAPYYAGFINHTAMVPLGVSNKKGNFEAYLEPAWQPQVKGASKWGGGSLFTFTKEGKTEWRGLKRFVNVPTFDLSQFILNNFDKDDEVVLKIDIEGAEYTVIDKMLKDGTFELVDIFFLEFHDWQPTGWTKAQKDDLRRRMKTQGVSYGKWEAEYPIIPNAQNWKPPIFGELQTVTSKVCLPRKGNVKLAIAIGMNKRRSSRLVLSVLAHNLTAQMNIAVFVYRDFIYDHPETVLQWARNPRIVLGMRGDSPRPVQYFRKMNYKDEINMMIISSIRQLVRTTGFSTEWFLPEEEGNRFVETALNSFRLKFSNNNVWVPPKDPSNLASPFFAKRSVEKIPPLLDLTY